MRRPKFRQNMEVFEKMLQDRELIVYGRGKETAAVCKKYKVKYIVDKNDEFCDLTVRDVKIYSPDKLYSEDPDKVMILICAAEKYGREITDIIQGIDDFIIFYWVVLKGGFLNGISNDLFDCYEKIHHIEQKLYDDRSRKILREVVVRRMAGMKTGYEDLKVEEEIQYIFPPALYSKNEGAVLDCGGYIGDTIDRFVNKLGNDLDKIYTFEALPENISALEIKKKTVSERWDGTIEIIPFAVADKKKTISFWDTGNREDCFSPDFRNTVRLKYTKPVGRFEVEAVRIDDMINKGGKRSGI